VQCYCYACIHIHLHYTSHYTLHTPDAARDDPGRALASLLSTVHGPFSFVYYDVEHVCVWYVCVCVCVDEFYRLIFLPYTALHSLLRYGRDRIGRRSLLQLDGHPDALFSLSSVAPPQHTTHTSTLQHTTHTTSHTPANSHTADTAHIAPTTHTHPAWEEVDVFGVNCLDLNSLPWESSLTLVHTPSTTHTHTACCLYINNACIHLHTHKHTYTHRPPMAAHNTPLSTDGHDSGVSTGTPSALVSWYRLSKRLCTLQKRERFLWRQTRWRR
jgi:hypothetical protein